MTLYQRFRLWRAAKRAERQVLDELACYTERELADMGLSRGDLPGIAREAFDAAWAEGLRAQRKASTGGFWAAHHA